MKEELSKDKLIFISRNQFEYEMIKEKLENYTYEEDEGVFVTEYKAGKIDGVLSFTPKEFHSLLNKSIEFEKIEPINYDFDWVKEENFSICYSNNVFATYTVDNKSIVEKYEVNNISKAFYSPDGTILAFVNNQTCKFIANDANNLVLEIELESSINKVVFSNNINQTYAILETDKNYYVLDVNKNSELLKFSSQSYEITYSGVYLKDDNMFMRFDDEIVSEVKCDKIFFSETDDRIVEFYKNGSQKIVIKKDNQIIKTKTFSSIIDIHVAFNTNQCICVFKNKNSSTFISIFEGDLITNKLIDINVNEVYATDNRLVIVDSLFKLHVFVIKTNSIDFKEIINKNNEVKLSLNRDVIVLFDYMESNIEFYDNEVCRTKFTFKNCSDMKWSCNKLYLAVYSYETAGNNLQIFNLNGKLIFKKNFDNLRSFEWRNYKVIDSVTRDLIIKNNSESISKLIEDDKEILVDKSELIKQWRDYLLTIKQ
ncbi:hypothetical protein HERIO_527 [Hepatospora eriocheir]|uniref:Translation initiation factor beta propellor-like domain-containing protein n=1 Tax=Hepatospora eriocheir TaxID=1081669 RepID=A0A1X0QCY9_9MICR|nr:hypothetical protein HERIO_527 [Hepatospora eriocheir]